MIFHVDVNSAFLSWSAVKRLQENPQAVDLRTIPSAVGGDVKTRRGVITARSIPAKAYGVKTGEPVVKALQKCPSLVLVRSDFETYRAYSRRFIGILRRYTDKVEQVSIDEAFLDATEQIQHRTENRTGALPQGSAPVSSAVCRQREEAERLAREIQREIRDTLGFTVNVGIAENKLLAKMASDFVKPDRVHTLYPEEIPDKFWPLPIGELYGCGRATAQKLEQMGLATIGEAAKADPAILRAALGEKHGTYIWRSANGYGSDTVHTEEEEAKSYSNETTTAQDIVAANYETEVPAIVAKLSGKVAQRMQRDHVFAATISVSAKTNTFQRRSRQETLAVSTNDAAVIAKTAEKLLRELLLGEEGLIQQGYGIRLIGVGGSHLDHGTYQQMGLQEAMRELEQARKTAEQSRVRAEKEERLLRMQEQLSARYGKTVVKKGSEAF